MFTSAPPILNVTNVLTNIILVTSMHNIPQKQTNGILCTFIRAHVALAISVFAHHDIVMDLPFIGFLYAYLQA